MTTTVLSCGVLVLAHEGDLLLGHATGAKHWDIPKGVMDAGETPRQAALRELREESGIEAAAEALLDLGRFAYRRGKDLHLFAMASARLDIATLACSATFVDRHGRVKPEFDAFAWLPFERLGERCAPSMAAVLTRSLSLPDVLARLDGH